jgi:hypothetical protein
MVPALTAADEKEDFELAESIKMIYQIAAKEEGEKIATLTEALQDLVVKKNVPPSVDGAATGLLYNANKLALEGALQRANAYFSASGGVLAMSGRFLRGLFLTAKDLVFYDNGFIEGLNGIIKDFPYDDFIKLLPDLRLSFTSFSPREIDLVAKKVLETIDLKLAADGKTDLTKLPVIDENDLKIIAEIDKRAMAYLKEKGGNYA